MPYIVSYRKKSDQYTTYTLNVPDGSTELCDIDGVTYVSIPDGETLPEQEPEIADSVETVTLDETLRERIKKESIHCKIINERMVKKIRERYTQDDEFFLARIAAGMVIGMYELQPGEEDEIAQYKAYTEAVREWGRQQRALLGLERAPQEVSEES